MTNDCSNALFSTYYGGSENDACYSVKVDSSLNIVFAGGTASNDLTGMAGGYQASFSGGIADGFIGKLNSNGTTMLAGTYLGTSNYDQVYFVEIDRNNKVFVTGQSLGGLFPVTNANYSIPNSNQFIAKLNENLSLIERSTVFGASNVNFLMSPSAFLVDRCGEIFVSGWGAQLSNPAVVLTGFPTTDDALQPNVNTTTDFYLIVIDRTFNDIIYGSFIGGANSSEHVDGGTSRFDQKGVVYQSVCAGCGGNSDFNTTDGAWSNQNNSPNCNNLVFKFDFQLASSSEFLLLDTVSCTGAEFQLENNSKNYSSYYWILDNGDTSYVFEPTVSYDQPGTYTIKLVVTDSVCLYVDSSEYIIEIGETFQYELNGHFLFCDSIDTNVIMTHFSKADSIFWSSNIDFSDTLNNPGVDSNFVANVTGSTTFYVKGKNGPCEQIDSVQFSTVSDPLDLADTISICLPETGYVELTTNPTFPYNYLWSPDSIVVGPNNLPEVSVNPTVSQYVFIEVDNQGDCQQTDSIWIDVHNLPQNIIEAFANPDTIPVGGKTNLYSKPAGYQYTWSPADLVNNPNLQNPTTTELSGNTIFTVSVGDGVCFKSQDVQIIVYEFICGRPGVYVPNAFSPDGNGSNDVLYVRSKVAGEVLFRVFNRWGQMMFETTDPNVGWDGKYKGKLMDPDTYDYYLKVVCVDGQEAIIKGNVTLLD